MGSTRSPAREESSWNLGGGRFIGFANNETMFQTVSSLLFVRPFFSGDFFFSFLSFPLPPLERPCASTKGRVGFSREGISGRKREGNFGKNQRRGTLTPCSSPFGRKILEDLEKECWDLRARCFSRNS